MAWLLATGFCIREGQHVAVKVVRVQQRQVELVLCTKRRCAQRDDDEQSGEVDPVFQTISKAA